MFLKSNTFSLFHEQCSKALMLELGGITIMDRDHTAVDVQFPHNRSLFEFRSEGELAALAQSQQSDQDVYSEG